MAKLKTGRHTGAIKAARQARRRMSRNRATRRHIRGLAKGFIEAAGKGVSGELGKLLPGIASAWDKAAKSGAVHWKAAARKKSRLALQARRVSAPSSAVKS